MAVGAAGVSGQAVRRHQTRAAAPEGRPGALAAGGSCSADVIMGEEGGACEVDPVSGAEVCAPGKREAPRRGARGPRKAAKNNERRESDRARMRREEAGGRGENWWTPGRGRGGATRGGGEDD